MATAENKDKQKPAFYIFAKDDKGESRKVGAAFKHASGNGFNIVIGSSRYGAFPPKARLESGQGG